MKGLINKAFTPTGVLMVMVGCTIYNIHMSEENSITQLYYNFELLILLCTMCICLSIDGLTKD